MSTVVFTLDLRWAAARHRPPDTSCCFHHSAPPSRAAPCSKLSRHPGNKHSMRDFKPAELISGPNWRRSSVRGRKWPGPTEPWAGRAVQPVAAAADDDEEEEEGIRGEKAEARGRKHVGHSLKRRIPVCLSPRSSVNRHGLPWSGDPAPVRGPGRVQEGGMRRGCYRRIFISRVFI